MKVTVNPDPGHVLPSSFKSYFSLVYRPLVNSATGDYGTPKTEGDGGQNDIGVPTGTPYMGAHDFTITGLSPHTTYSVALTAFDEYGHKFQPGAPASVTTADVTPPLDFDGPIQLSMNPDTGLTVSWKSNRPVKTATLAVKFTDDTTLDIQPKTTATALNVKVTTDVNAIGALIKKTSTSAVTPIIQVSMTDGTETKAASFSFEVVVPSKSASTDQATKKAVENVAKAATGNGKVSWPDVVKTGLGILMKFI